MTDSADCPTATGNPGRGGRYYPILAARSRHDSWQKFEQWRNEAGFRLVLFTTKGAGSYLDFSYRRVESPLFRRGAPGAAAPKSSPAAARAVTPNWARLLSLQVGRVAAVGICGVA